MRFPARLNFRFSSVLFALISAASASFGADSVPFSRDVRPILSDKCFKCHGPDAESREAGLRLDLREDAAVVLDIEDSELLRRITTADLDELMPPADSKLSLSDREKQILRDWIAAGAQYEGHWSFQSVQRPDVPTIHIDKPGWSTAIPGTPAMNEIDQFVAAELHARRLEPQPQANRERLIRRVYFDLIGLPPSIEDIDSFLADKSADAYEKVVDRLLASDAYGERLASDWLDAARYSDTYGYQVDRDRYVWPWRDWLIRAINSNLPYDDFMTWQLAGDMLPDPTDDQILATTFNRLHPQKVEGGSVPEEFRVEYVADRNHTFGTAFLGLTLECCRCHDHKYDPISQREYYQLFAFFNNIDEAGLYSYFTNSIPTPTKLLANDKQVQEIALKRQAIAEAESQLAKVRSEQNVAFIEWLKGASPISGELAGQIADETFEDGNGANKTVPGKFGSAAKLTGDDAIGLKVGNFRRSQPFSISLWLNTPDVKERAVVFHRSRAWTDAGSRGYQLLLEDGKLSFSLIHFWPGNAIRVRTPLPIETNQWVQCTVTYDGSSRASGVKLYANGRMIDTDVVRDNLYKNITGGGGDNIAIGQRFRDRGFTGGLVDEFKVFERELTPIEVQQNFGGNPLNQRLAVIREHEVKQSAAEMPRLRDFYLSAYNEPYKMALATLQKARQSHNDLVNGIQEIMVMKDMPKRRQSHVLNRGMYDSPTEPVEPDTPAVLPPFPTNGPRNRLGLARWLTSEQNPLASRVAVNRFWKICFGEGLVRTPEDFGSQGAQPTHPELLDWLASDFMANGWDVKRLLKQMVMSSTYRQRSTPSNQASFGELVRRDPENEWYARAPRYRLPAEMIRDNALQSSGLLVRKVGGPSAKPYEVAVSFKPVPHEDGDGLYRRSLYTFWKRTAPAPVMMTLDASKRDVCSVKRERTASPLQAFVLLNDPQFVEASRVLAQGLIQANASIDGRNVNKMITTAFRRLTSRQPTASEQKVLHSLYESQLSYFKSEVDMASKFLEIGKQSIADEVDPNELAALTIVVNAIMNLDECVTKR